jgi:hypothetical protein
MGQEEPENQVQKSVNSHLHSELVRHIVLLKQSACETAKLRNCEAGKKGR